MDSRKNIRTRARRGRGRPERLVPLDDGDAFVPDSRRGFVRLSDDEAEAFAEEFIAGVTSGEGVSESARDEAHSEELSGFSFDTAFEDDAESAATSPLR